MRKKSIICHVHDCFVITDATLKCLNGIYEVEEGNGGQRDSHLKMMNIKTHLIKRTEPLRSRRSIRQPFVMDNEKTQKFVEPKSAATTPSNHHDHSSLLAHNGHKLIKRISRSIIHDHDDEQTTDWTPEIPFQNVGHLFLRAFLQLGLSRGNVLCNQSINSSRNQLYLINSHFK